MSFLLHTQHQRHLQPHDRWKTGFSRDNHFEHTARQASWILALIDVGQHGLRDTPMKGSASVSLLEWGDEHLPHTHILWCVFLPARVLKQVVRQSEGFLLSMNDEHVPSLAPYNHPLHEYRIPFSWNWAALYKFADMLQFVLCEHRKEQTPRLRWRQSTQFQSLPEWGVLLSQNITFSRELLISWSLFCYLPHFVGQASQIVYRPSESEQCLQSRLFSLAYNTCFVGIYATWFRHFHHNWQLFVLSAADFDTYVIPLCKNIEECANPVCNLVRWENATLGKPPANNKVHGKHNSNFGTVLRAGLPGIKCSIQVVRLMALWHR